MFFFRASPPLERSPLETKAGGKSRSKKKETRKVIRDKLPENRTEVWKSERVHSRNQNVISFNNKSTVLYFIYFFTWRRKESEIVGIQTIQSETEDGERSDAKAEESRLDHDDNSFNVLPACCRRS